MPIIVDAESFEQIDYSICKDPSAAQSEILRLIGSFDEESFGVAAVLAELKTNNWRSTAETGHHKGHPGETTKSYGWNEDLFLHLTIKSDGDETHLRCSSQMVSFQKKLHGNS